MERSARTSAGHSPAKGQTTSADPVVHLGTTRYLRPRSSDAVTDPSPRRFDTLVETGTCAASLGISLFIRGGRGSRSRSPSGFWSWLFLILCICFPLASLRASSLVPFIYNSLGTLGYFCVSLSARARVRLGCSLLSILPRAFWPSRCCTD
jgi:hypothetical protein